MAIEPHAQMPPVRRTTPGRWIVNRDHRLERETRPVLPVEGMDEAQRNEIYEAAKKADYEIQKLQALPMSELMELAQREQIDGSSGLGRQELLFQILRRRATSSGLGWAEGVLDILPDGFGFLRSAHHHYVAGPDDIYVSPSQVRRLNLKQGHEVAGPVRPPKEGEKYFALLHVETVNGGTIEQLRQRIPFDDLTPVMPQHRLRLEHPECTADLRVIDLLAPLGKGQRVLVSTPPFAGRNRLLVHIAQGLLHNHPETYLIHLLLDARHEEVTEVLRRTGPETRREVVAATFDEPPARQIALAELALERARRMVEAGRDVVLLVDSLTALTRAYNIEVPHSGKVLSVGLDAVALHKPKRLFASARSIEEGGSLTVVATSLTDTKVRVNDVIHDEFAGRANCDIVLDRHLAELHVVPAIDVVRTGTRMEDNLMEGDELDTVRRLRRTIDGEDTARALEALLELIQRSPTNAELLARI